MAAANAKPWKHAKPWKQQAPVLVAALLLLGLALPLPSSAAPLKDCAEGLALFNVGVFDDQCRDAIIRGTSSEVGNCCDELEHVIRGSGSGDDCACSLQKAFAERDIEIDTVCRLDMTKEKCQAKEDAEKAKADAAQQREDELTKLGACDRLFERLAAGELSKISRDDDIIACRREMKTCPASCRV